MRAANASAQLVQLSQTEMVRALDDNGIGGRDIDPGLNDGGTDQHVKALVVEIIHHPFQLALAHLPVTDGNTCLRHQLRESIRRFLDILHVVIEVVDRRRAALHAESPREPPASHTPGRRFSPPDGGRAAWQ